jgi:DNA replication and checkpoint protein
MLDNRPVQEARCEVLRSEIKAWEREHLEQKGTKPSRDDVKANPDIGRECFGFICDYF